jgi:hypothetical protein
LESIPYFQIHDIPWRHQATISPISKHMGTFSKVEEKYFAAMSSLSQPVEKHHASVIDQQQNPTNIILILQQLRDCA